MGNADYYCDMPICSPCTPMQLTATSGGQKANTMYVVLFHIKPDSLTNEFNSIIQKCIIGCFNIIETCVTFCP